MESLRELIRRSGVPSGAELRIPLLRLSQEIKGRLSRSTASSLDYFSDCLDVLSKLRGSTNATLRMECLYDCGSYFYHGGHLVHALRCTELLEEAADAAGDTQWRRKALGLSGIVHADVGNIGEALEKHARAIELAQSIGDLDGEVRGMLNTGVALNYGSLYREAIPCFLRAIVFAESLDSRSGLLATAHINLAQSYLFLEQFEHGFEAASAAIAYSPEPSDAATALSRIVREFTYVQLAIEVGRMREAVDHAARCRRYLRWNDSHRAIALSNIANGLCEVHGGDVRHGLELLENAFDRSKGIASTSTVALVALVRAYDRTGMLSHALARMGELLVQVRAKRELAISAMQTWSGLDRKLSPLHQHAAADLAALEIWRARLTTKAAEQEIAAREIEMFERLAVTADIREEASGEHGYRVGKLSSLVAEKLGWDPHRCCAIEIAGRLHDIGKLAVPDRILVTSKVLQDAERHFMMAHTTIGAELLSRSELPELKMAEDVARSHHEWWNGSGYPSKLKGKHIPLPARIVALSDVFDALTHGRPFASSWTIEEALNEIEKNSDSQFDPALTVIFVDLVRALSAKHSDLSAFLSQNSQSSNLLRARTRIRSLIQQERTNEANCCAARSI